MGPSSPAPVLTALHREQKERSSFQIRGWLTSGVRDCEDRLRERRSRRLPLAGQVWRGPAPPVRWSCPRGASAGRGLWCLPIGPLRRVWGSSRAEKGLEREFAETEGSVLSPSYFGGGKEGGRIWKLGREIDGRQIGCNAVRWESLTPLLLQLENRPLEGMKFSLGAPPP